MEDGKPIKGSLYVYAPNKVAPVFFALAFAVSGVCHVWQCYRFKSFKLTGLHPICALLFTIGFAVREYGAFNYMYESNDSQSLLNLIMYIVSVCAIYVSPPLLELANYHVLGRIFCYIPYFSPLPPGRVLSTFGGLSAFVEGLNGLGVSFLSNAHSPHLQSLGRDLIIAALVLQLVVIACFVVLAAIFYHRCSKSQLHIKVIQSPLVTLYISTSLIFIRCIYRTIENTGDTSTEPDHLASLSPILRYEWFFYVFEATIMLLNSILWNIRHPRRSLPQNSHVYLAQDGETEVEGKVKKEGKPLLAWLTLGIFFREKRESWESRELGDDRSQGSVQVRESSGAVPI